MGTKLVNVDRQTPMLLPVDLREWVPADDVVHLVVEAVEGMDTAAMPVNQRGTGSAQYPPAMLLALLIYSYSQGLYSSRRIERATHTHVGVRYLCGDTHPDHDTIATFRRSQAELVELAFVEVLQLARALGMPKLGTVCLDGTKLGANASKRATRTEAELRQEVQARLASAEQTDRTDTDTEQLPPALTERHTRLARLQAARAALAQKARERDKDVDDDDPGNPTDPDSRLMPTAQKVFIQGYNAQLAVSADSGLIVGTAVCNDTHDRRQFAPLSAAIKPEAGVPHTIVADAGYDNSPQIRATELRTQASVYVPAPRAYRSPDRQSAHRTAITAERTQRQARVDTPLGQRLMLLRRTVVEPVFGTLKYTWRFTRFHLRGLAAVKTEWQLLCTAYNLRKIATWRRLTA